MLIKIKKAEACDLKEILRLQKAAYQSEAELYKDYSIPPLVQSLEDIKEEYKKSCFLIAEKKKSIIGSVRAVEEDGTCKIGRLIVRPDSQNQGIGKMLMAAIEAKFPDCGGFELFTGKRSIKNIRLYESLGYERCREEEVNERLALVYMKKLNRRGVNG